MSVEAEQRDHYQDVRQRLMGTMPKAERGPRHDFIPPMQPPEPLRPVELPKPTRQQLDTIAGEDTVWRQGVKHILSAYGENLRRLRAYHRDKHIVECRTEVARYLRDRGWSTARIGAYVNRDHSSITHLLNPVTKRKSYERRKTARRAEPIAVVADAGDAIDLTTTAVFGVGGWVVSGRVARHGEASDEPQDMVEPTGRG